MKRATTTQLSNLATLAARIGCPQDQLYSFLVAGYVPQLKQLEFHAAAAAVDSRDGPSYIAYAGTRGQAKSHAEYAQASLYDMQRYAGMKWLYLRKIKGKAVESMADLRRKVLQFTPHEFKNNTLTLPNGSTMIMGGFRGEAEIDAYLGRREPEAGGFPAGFKKIFDQRPELLSKIVHGLVDRLQARVPIDENRQDGHLRM